MPKVNKGRMKVVVFGMCGLMFGSILIGCQIPANDSIRILGNYLIHSETKYDYFEKNHWMTAMGVLPSAFQRTDGELTGAVIVETQAETSPNQEEDYLQLINQENGNVEVSSPGESYKEEEEVVAAQNVKVKKNSMVEELKTNKSAFYLLQNFYIIDSTTSVDQSIFKVDKLIKKDISLKKSSGKKILIYHTHAASEGFIDSKGKSSEDGIVAIGGYLTKILKEVYGYEVIHDTTQYDIVNGIIDRNKAYTAAYKGISALLEKDKDIAVVIDLHRDGVGKNVHTYTKVDGKQAAQVMFFNGLSRNKNGDIAYLKNDNLEDNLAFSLQLKMKAMELYPDFTRPIYLKGYRYNLHLAKRSLLIELGNQNNTVQEAKNAMPPLAKVLDSVLR